MTLQELYDEIGGSYEQAAKVMRIDKLINKHIRKFPNGGVAEALIGAGESMDPVRLFETAHAMKGVCSNLGLVKLADSASTIAEEFRPGNPRRLSDAEVKAVIVEIKNQYQLTVEGINKYSEA